MVQGWSLIEFNRLVLACSSEYLVSGVYDRVGTGRKLVHRCKSHWNPDRHEDLWQVLMSELKRCDEQGLLVQFWKIREGVNEANTHAQTSALSSMAEMNHVPPKIAEAAAIIDKL